MDVYFTSKSFPSDVSLLILLLSVNRHIRLSLPAMWFSRRIEHRRLFIDFHLLRERQVSKNHDSGEGLAQTSGIRLKWNPSGLPLLLHGICYNELK
jgi:hypothetical protein